MPLDLIRGWIPVLRSEYAQIDYSRKGLMRKRSRGRTGSHLTAAPALHQAIAGPGKPRQRRIDALVGKAGRRPAVDQAIYQPDHQKGHQTGGCDIGEKMPAKRHPEPAGDDAEQGRRSKSQRPPCWRRQRGGSVGPECGSAFAGEKRTVAPASAAWIPPRHERLRSVELRDHDGARPAPIALEG